MNKKSIRFSAVAAVLLTLCLVFIAPVVAEDTVVAKIGDTSYTDLQTAIGNAADGAEIVLVANFELTAQNAQELFKPEPAYNRESYCGIYIPDDKKLTIDLAGHSVSYYDEYGDVDNVMILNLGDLTINDSVGGGKLSYTPVAGSSTYSKFYSTIFNCGNLTVNGGTIENLAAAETDVTNAVDCHSRLSHAYGNDCILTVNDGTLTGAYYYAVHQYTHYFEGVKNRVIINGGTIEGGIYMQHGDSWYYADASKNRLNVDGYLTINGGNFVPTDTPDQFNTIKSRLSNPDNNKWGLEITGGNFEGTTIQLLVQRGVYYENGVSGTTVPAETAGTRNTEWLEKRGGFITGGTFTTVGDSNDVTTNLASFVKEDYRLANFGNGLFGVTDGWIVTFIDGTTEYDIQDVENGKTAERPDNPSKEGYTFNGWFTEEDSVNEYIFTTPVTRDLTLYANWTVNQYTITPSVTEVGFDSVKVGYSQPEAQTVIITNDGNVPVTLTAPTSENYAISLDKTTLAVGETAILTIQPEEGLAVGNYADKFAVTNNAGEKVDIAVSFLVYQPSSGGSSTTKPEEPVEPEVPVEPETPTDEPVAGEVTVETEVTDGGEVEFEAPVEEPEAGEVGTPAAEDEAKITGVVLPTGTEGKVEFVPVSEQAAPEGKETQTKKVFEINVPTYEKGKPAVIKFQMTVEELAADGKEAADVALWHFDEETGEWTKLVTSYTIVDGIVYFEAITNDFSPFAIVYEDEPVNEPVEEPETPASPAPVFAVLAALGAAVVLRRK